MRAKHKKQNSAKDRKISDLKALIKVQCSDGNWNYDAYMHGMANGMLLALSCLDGSQPNYLDAPDVWLCDIKNTVEPEA